MTQYQVDFTYNIPMWGDVVLDADGTDQAEEFGLEQIREMADDDWTNIEITGVREIKNG